MMPAGVAALRGEMKKKKKNRQLGMFGWLFWAGDALKIAILPALFSKKHLKCP